MINRTAVIFVECYPRARVRRFRTKGLAHVFLSSDHIPKIIGPADIESDWTVLIFGSIVPNHLVVPLGSHHKLYTIG